MKIIKDLRKIVSTIIIIIMSSLGVLAQGPNAPEATAFEPVDATDMVNLATGDLSYVMPLLNIPSPEGGYPLSISYHAGIAMNQEASWVGLGWSLNPGAINRSVNGYPDDWKKTRVNTLFYDAGGSTDYYSFDIGGTLPNGLTLGVSRSWGGYRAWGGVVGYGGQRFSFQGNNFSVESQIPGTGIGITAISGQEITIGKSFGILNYGPLSIGANVGYNMGTGNVSTSGAASLKMRGTGISYDTVGGISASSGVAASSNNSSVSQNDYIITTTDNSFGIDIGFFWAKYRHTKVSYSLFKDNISYTSGILNAFDFRALDNMPTDSDTKKMMDIKEFYADDDNYLNTYSHEGYDLAGDPTITLPNYDNYSVSAQGIGGIISPRIYDEITLVGQDYYRDDGGWDEQKRQMSYYNRNWDNQDEYILGNKINFYFNSTNSSYLRTNTGDFAGGQLVNNAINGIFDGTNLSSVYNTETNNTYSNTNTIDGNLKKVGERKRDGNFIETFTNRDIENNNTNGWFLESNAEGFDRYNLSGTDGVRRDYNEVKDGIGAYRITTTDGKVYHYSLPVYHFESISKNFAVGDNENTKFFQSKKIRPYATHWLLTAITGPDYVDVNSNGKPDENDYGYWVEFDYGKWSSGFSWRSPKEGFKVFDGSNSYFIGIKEVYYLDHIKTRTHTALFVKSLREDGKSQPISIYNNKWNGTGNIGYSTYSKNYNGDFKQYTLSGEYYLAGPITSETLVNYNNVSLSARKWTNTYIDIPENYSLKLDQILILKNEDAIYDKTLDVNLVYDRKLGYTYHNSGYSLGTAQSSALQTLAYNKMNLPYSGPNFHWVNRDDNILDEDDIINLGLENKAIKTIDFKYNYSLGGNLPNATSGKHLTLTEIQTKGKSQSSLIPPYKFSYAKPNIAYDNDNQDVWGYVIDNPDAWSLNKIEIPTGGSIEIDYESDSFYAEAAYNTSGTQHSFEFNTKNTQEVQEDVNIIDMNKGMDYVEIFLDPNNMGDLSQIAQVGNNVKLYLTNAYSYDLNPNLHYIGNFKSLANNYSIESIDTINGSIRFIINELTDIDKHQELFNSKCPLGLPGNHYTPQSENEHCVSNIRFSLDANTLTYNDPNGKKGGGVRVKNVKITENGNTYITNYNYSNPVTNTISGITSYEPFDGNSKEIPYIQEIPAPNVLYSNVCVSSNNSTGNNIITKYTFNTLKPYNLSDNEDLLFSLGDEFKIVRSQMVSRTEAGQYVGSPTPESPGFSIYKNTIHNSLSNIGSLLSIKNYNAENQLLNETTNEYFISDHNSENHFNGINQESFKTYKSRQFNKVNSNGTLWTSRFYNVGSSSNINYPTVLESKITKAGGFTHKTDFTKRDFLTGQVIETITENSKGEKFKTEIVPAYHINDYNQGTYSMGAKVDLISNNNMLTQQAISKTYIDDNDTWKETGIGITTWSNEWDYTNYNGSVTTPTDPKERIWRKSRSFTWDGDINEDGTYKDFVGVDDNFNWSNGDLATQSNTKWKNISKTTKYDHYSMPLEIEDINNNHAATKMCDNDTKVMAVANSKYTEMYYSGAEYLVGGFQGQYFDAQVKTDHATQTSEKAHTGQFSVIANSGIKVFEVNLKNGEHKAGKYKISVWVERSNASNARIHINGMNKLFNGEKVTAGNWVMLNHYETISDGDETIYLTSNSGVVYMDDFRIHPIASSMTSYVYNEWDELSFILGSNNLGTHFIYDSQGRLIETQKEVIDTDTLPGGFKKISENFYNYKNQ